jgi:hypothetical protein
MIAEFWGSGSDGSASREEVGAGRPLPSRSAGTLPAIGKGIGSAVGLFYTIAIWFAVLDLEPLDLEHNLAVAPMLLG